MAKIFHSFVKKYQVVPSHRLYGDFRKYLETDFTRSDSSIYFVVKCKNVRWIPASFKIKRQYQILGYLEVDGTEHRVTIDMAKFWFSMPEMRKHFQEKEAMAAYFLERITNLPWRLLPPDWRYMLLSKMLPSESEGDKLVVDCQLRKNMNIEGYSRTDIYAYQAINSFCLPAPKLEIIYIGSSVTNTFDRLYEHEKWGRLQGEKRRDEDILVYFAELESDMLETRQLKGISILSKATHGLSRIDETRISEMALINYFKPKYNELHTERDIKQSSRIRKVLGKNGYDKVTVEVLLEGAMGAIGTTHVGRYGEHTANHNIA